MVPENFPLALTESFTVFAPSFEMVGMRGAYSRHAEICHSVEEERDGDHEASVAYVAAILSKENTANIERQLKDFLEGRAPEDLRMVGSLLWSKIARDTLGGRLSYARRGGEQWALVYERFSRISCWLISEINRQQKSKTISI
jgi:hypothetical protein